MNKNEKKVVLKALYLTIDLLSLTAVNAELEAELDEIDKQLNLVLKARDIINKSND